MQAWTFRLGLKRTDKIDFARSIAQRFSSDNGSLQSFVGVSLNNDENWWSNVKGGLQCLSKLRDEAVEGVSRVQDLNSAQQQRANITRYFAALEFVAKRLDLTDKGAQVLFAWCDVFNPMKRAQQRHIALERACLAFNLAVCDVLVGHCLFSQVLNSHSDTSLLKEACRRYQLAAGHFAVLCTAPPDGAVTTDLGLEALHLFQAAALASAQTCMCEYAQRTGMKETNVAVLCAGAASCWSQVVQRARLKLLNGDGNYKQIGDCAQYLSVFYEREAEIQMSNANAERDEKGEQIARLKKAITLSQSLRKLAKNLVHTSCFPGVPHIKNRADQITSKLEVTLKSAEKDNDAIYMQTVPNTPSPVQNRVAVKPAGVTDTLSSVTIEEDILLGFSSLVPLHLRSHASNFGSQIHKTLDNSLRDLNQSTLELKNKIATMEEYLYTENANKLTSVLSPEHIQVICYIRDNGGWSRLEEMKEKVSNLSVEVRRILSYCEDALSPNNENKLISHISFSTKPTYSQGSNSSPSKRGHLQELSPNRKHIKTLESFQLQRNQEHRIISVVEEALHLVSQEYIDARKVLIERLETAKNILARKESLQKEVKEECSQDALASYMTCLPPNQTIENALKTYVDEQSERVTNLLSRYFQEQRMIMSHLEDAFNDLHQLRGELDRAIAEILNRVKAASTVYESWKEIRDALEQGISFYQKALKSAKQLAENISRRIGFSLQKDFTSEHLQHVQQKLETIHLQPDIYSATTHGNSSQLFVGSSRSRERSENLSSSSNNTKANFSH
eukprot:jgi/Galph1/2347/GphlegSOOS_G1022.1